MKPQIIKLNSKEAQRLLETNNDNRQYNERHVGFLANQMQTGKWKFTADPIRVSKSGKLLDGQHRLMALIKADKEFDFLVIKDLEDNIFDVLDTGKIRSAGDVLSINKVTKANKAASIVKFVIAFQKGAYSVAGGGDGSKRAYIANSDILKFARKHSDNLTEVIDEAISLTKHFKLMSFQLLGGCYYLFSALHSEDAHTFFQKLVNGTDLKENCPIRHLRERFIKNQASKSKLSAREKLALTIHAWNAFRTKKDIKVLVNKSEKFPTPL